jgi:hypothetical protein
MMAIEKLTDEEIRKINTSICYKCGVQSGFTAGGSWVDRCDCGVGWHCGKPNQQYIKNLPKDWHCHTLRAA